MRAFSTVLGLAMCAFWFSGCTPAGSELLKTERLAIEDGSNEHPPKSIESAGFSLDPTTKEIINTYGPVIRRYSTLYGLDWRLVLAVMKCESSFNERAESQRGAVGFMQLMPHTGAEVGKVLSIDVTARPTDNIHGGIYYLHRIYDLFQSAEPAERLKLTLAAYNAGIGRIYDAQDVAAYLLEDPNRWESIRDALPLLSKRYYTLHRSVWEDQHPRSGWFGKSGETIAYVDRIMDYYDEYRLLIN